MPRKYTDEQLERAVKESYSCANVLRLLGIKQAGGSQSHIMRRIRSLNLDTKHWKMQAHNKGKVSPQKLSWVDVLVKNRLDRRENTVKLKRAMIESGIEEKCNDCGIGPYWNGANLSLQIDHKDRDSRNNLRENLRFLCPNCHSQYGTSKSKIVIRII